MKKTDLKVKHICMQIAYYKCQVAAPIKNSRVTGSKPSTNL